MPIIEPPDPGLPISQGDILQGVNLFIIKDGWMELGGEQKGTKHKLCLIISRPCVVGHKPNAIVAAIEKMADNVPREVKAFEDIVDFLTTLRGGADSPDVFYLGQIPGFDGRFGARLDSLHTVQIPPANEQGAFTDEKRVGRLHGDFVRDLHTRIFQAFAVLGFDDDRWMSTQDLKWAVAQGEKDLLEAKAVVQTARTALLAGEAQGFQSLSAKQALEANITAAQAKLDQLRPRVEPYEIELASRSQLPPGGTRDDPPRPLP